MIARTGIPMLLLAAAAAVAAQEPRPAGALLGGTLSFDARATMGDFTGTTTAVRGQATGGPDLADVTGWVEAPVDSLRTGVGLRDRDMRKALDADEFPVLRFDLDSLLPSPRQGNTMVATLAGRFTIHGVTRSVRLPATLTWENGTIRVEARHRMDVRDYHVEEGLSRLFGLLRMEPEIVVRVDLRFRDPTR